MIFKIKYKFVILELIGQLYFVLKRNNSKNEWNKCLKTLFHIVEERLIFFWTLISVLYNDVQKGQ